MKNKEFIFTSLGSSSVMIHNFVFTTILGQLVAPYGITDQ